MRRIKKRCKHHRPNNKHRCSFSRHPWLDACKILQFQNSHQTPPVRLQWPSKSRLYSLLLLSCSGAHGLELKAGGFGSKAWIRLETIAVASQKKIGALCLKILMRGHTTNNQHTGWETELLKVLESTSLPMLWSWVATTTLIKGRERKAEWSRLKDSSKLS